MFYKVFLELCNKKGISPSAAVEAMGLQRSVNTRWSKGAEPRKATILKVADFFNVDPEIFDEKIEKEMPTTLLSDEQIEFLNLLKNSDEAHKAAAILTLKDGQPHS